MRKKLRYIPVKRKKTLRGEQKEIKKCSRQPKVLKEIQAGKKNDVLVAIHMPETLLQMLKAHFWLANFPSTR